jgi:hypothetical protein
VHRCLGGHRWWCFDAYLADGAKLVMSFMEKDLGQPQKPLSPLLRLNLELPDGRIFDKAVRYPVRMVRGQGPRRCPPQQEPIHRRPPPVSNPGDGGGHLGRCHLDRTGSTVSVRTAPDVCGQVDPEDELRVNDWPIHNMKECNS